MSAASALNLTVASCLPEGWEIDDEGFLIDDRGEVREFVGVLRHPGEAPFRPDTRDKADWVLAKMADQEARLLALDARRRVLLANLERQQKAIVARLEGLHRRFDADLEALARRELAGGRSRTLQLDHGRISFRLSKGTTKILDMPRAVAWMRSAGYGEAVRVAESVTASDVAKAIDQVAAPEADVAAFVERTGPREGVAISAGIRED